jgi:hypothetical protein
MAVFFAHEMSHATDLNRTDRLASELRSYEREVEMMEAVNPARFDYQIRLVKALLKIARAKPGESEVITADMIQLARDILLAAVHPRVALESLISMMNYKLVAINNTAAVNALTERGFTDVQRVASADIKKLESTVLPLLKETMPEHITFYVQEGDTAALEAIKQLQEKLDMSRRFDKPVQFGVFLFTNAETDAAYYLGRMAAWVGIEQFQDVYKGYDPGTGHYNVGNMLQNAVMKALVAELSSEVIKSAA